MENGLLSSTHWTGEPDNHSHWATANRITSRGIVLAMIYREQRWIECVKRHDWPAYLWAIVIVLFGKGRE